VNLLMFSRFNTAIRYLHKYHPQTAIEPTHPQTKSLPWIHTYKTGQVKSFQHECEDADTGHI
jgi:hypothetical protein